MRAQNRPEMSELEQACDLRTNIEVRAAFLALVYAGHTQTDAAAMLNRTAGWGFQTIRKPRPVRVRGTSAWLERAGESLRCECGAAPSRGTEQQMVSRGVFHRTEFRCPDCVAKLSAERERSLVAIAERTGFVPTVSEAQEATGLSRSQAGALLMAVFGPDPRDGAQRQGMRRPYEDGAVVV